MQDTITLTGFVATEPRHLVTSTQLPVTSFRLASSHGKFDKEQQQWVPKGTNWYTISAFRQLAVNASISLKKGDRVLVTGRLRIEDWEKDDKSGTSVEILADSIGHDLTWGSSRFARTTSSTSIPGDGDDGAKSEGDDLTQSPFGTDPADAGAESAGQASGAWAVSAAEGASAEDEALAKPF